MQKLVFKNGNGVEINFTSGSYGITEWEGFSADSLNVQSQQVPFQDGAVFLDALMEQRDLNITLAMQDNGNLEKRYQMRREIISVMNPKLGEGVLIYTNDFLSKQIHVVPQLPVFNNHNSNDSGTPKASLSWTSCNPYWEDLEETSIFLKAGSRKVIENSGDVVTGVKVDLFTNNVTNPQVKSFTENKLIKLSGNFQNGVNINTNIGQKQVTTEELIFDLSNIAIVLNSITYSESLGLFVIVGEGGVILTSSDGITWTSRTSGVSANLLSVTYSESLGLFVVVGYGRILTSSDGITWISRTSGVSIYLYGITYSESLGLFVTVGTNGTILTSSDGITWTSRTSGVSANLLSVTYSESLGLFVTVGASGRILTSSDGITWISRTSGVSSILYFITYSESLGLFVIVGEYGAILTSSDGITWISRTSGVSGTFRDVTYSENLGLFVTVGASGTILTSTDTITWTGRTSGISGTLRAITYSESLGLFVTVGASGTILTSTDTITWTSRTSGVSTYLYGITYSESLGLFVIVGNNGRILTSSDGITWTSRTSGVSTYLYGITYSESLGLFVIVGEVGTILNSIFTLVENLISTLTSDSDMTLGLEVGLNEILLLKSAGNLNGRIRFRQKYIGV